MKKFIVPVVIVIVLGILTVSSPHLTRFWQHLSEESRPNTGGNHAIEPAKDPAKNKPAPSPGETPPPKPGSMDSPDYVPPASPSPQTGHDQPVDKQDKTVYSWWFKRSAENNTPIFDPGVVAMVKGKGLYLGNTSAKKIYLTFDEGYENGYTPEILDTLKANQVKAAFFVTADFVNKQPDLVRRMAAEGHIIGNHTATHPSLPKLTDREIETEINTTHEKVSALTGISIKFMRPPMGEYNLRVLDEVNSLDYKAVFWSLAYRDWEVDKQPGREAAFNNVIENLHPGAIILLHAVSSSNTEALDDIIQAAKNRGYSFGTLNEME